MTTLTGVIATCQICEREYSEEPDLIPRILTDCGHTLCTECAKHIVSGNLLVCPFDRIKTNIKGGDVKNLKKNFSILQIKEDEKFRKKQRQMTKNTKKERHNDGTCDENSAHQASHFCRSCEADLCDECWDYAHSMTILSHHEKLALFLHAPIETSACETHLEEQAAFVCKVKECCDLQTRLMCHKCYVEDSKHQGHGYVTIQEEIAEMRTKIKNSLQVAEEKEVTIQKNIESIETVRDSYSVHGQVFSDKCSEMLRFRFFDAEKENQAVEELRKAMNRRKEELSNRIANQRADLDWITKNKAGIKRLMVLPNIKLVNQRYEVDLLVPRLEAARIRHPKSLAKFDMCMVHVQSVTPMTVDIKPAHRLDIRESYHKTVTSFIEQNTSLVSPRNNLLRYKNHFLRLIERTEDAKLYSEGLSLILVVDPFNGDRDRQDLALELLEKQANGYERIVVGLNPFNYQEISTFLAKLIEIRKKDHRVKIVYLNDPEKDIEKMVDLAFKV